MQYSHRSDGAVDLAASPLREVRALLAALTGSRQSLYAGMSRKQLARKVKAEFAKMNRYNVQP